MRMFFSLIALVIVAAALLFVGRKQLDATKHLANRPASGASDAKLPANSSADTAAAKRTAPKLVADDVNQMLQQGAAARASEASQ